MSVSTFVQRQITQIRQGGRPVVARKLRLVSGIALRLLLFVLAVPAVIVIRLIRPWLLVRIGALVSTRIGHFAANTELYLCERDAGINVPQQRHLDLFFCISRSLCNKQLATMWERLLRVWPAWILAPIHHVNRLLPGWQHHDVGTNTQNDRDVHNLLDRFPPHLKFTPEEESRGAAGLRAMGIPPGIPFVCLNMRDSAYLHSFHKQRDWSYHNYRDSTIANYVLAAEELANRGYFVIRMGAKVLDAMKSTHPRVIDYATNGMRSDFMDIYLGAKCEFFTGVGEGFCAVPLIFRRPIAYVNMVPLGYLFTFSAQFLGITKHHFLKDQNRELTLAEIFSHGVGFSLHTSDYESRGIDLIENTPEEIRDVVIEMAERMNGTWRHHEDDEALQKRFWDIFPTSTLNAINKRPHHGEIRARFGAVFLRDNRWWLELPSKVIHEPSKTRRPVPQLRVK